MYNLYLAVYLVIGSDFFFRCNPQNHKFAPKDFEVRAANNSYKTLNWIKKGRRLRRDRWGTTQNKQEFIYTSYYFYLISETYWDLNYEREPNKEHKPICVHTRTSVYLPTSVLLKDVSLEHFCWRNTQRRWITQWEEVLKRFTALLHDVHQVWRLKYSSCESYCGAKTN